MPNNYDEEKSQILTHFIFNKRSSTFTPFICDSWEEATFNSALYTTILSNFGFTNINFA